MRSIVELLAKWLSVGSSCRGALLLSNSECSLCRLPSAASVMSPSKYHKMLSAALSDVCSVFAQPHIERGVIKGKDFVNALIALKE